MLLSDLKSGTCDEEHIRLILDMRLMTEKSKRKCMSFRKTVCFLSWIDLKSLFRSKINYFFSLGTVHIQHKKKKFSLVKIDS